MTCGEWAGGVTRTCGRLRRRSHADATCPHPRPDPITHSRHICCEGRVRVLSANRFGLARIGPSADTSQNTENEKPVPVHGLHVWDATISDPPSGTPLECERNLMRAD